MSMLNDYKEAEEKRQVVASQANEFYKTVNVPGNRTMGNTDKAARDRIADMAKVKSLPNHD